MAESSQTESLPPLRQIERRAILAAIFAVTALAWAYLVFMAGMMPAMNPAEVLAMRPWTAVDFVLMLLMWVVMMIGMMLPTAAPMTLIYARVARMAEHSDRVLPPTAFFASGYLLAWAVFSLAATIVQWGLDSAALLSPMMRANQIWLGSGLLIAAGAYQLTPWKDACLRHCRAPAHFFARHFRPGRSGAFRLGWTHGLYCLGCCWALMGLLFVGGVMSLLWIAAITLFVLIEKILPYGGSGGRIAGIGLIVLGVATLAGFAVIAP